MFVLDRDDDSNKDYEGDDGDGEEGGKDDVGLLLDLLGSRHLTNRREAQHHNELEAGEKKQSTHDPSFVDDRWTDVQKNLIRKVMRKHPQIQMSRIVG